MRNLLTDCRTCRSGSSAVEFALVFPLLVVLLYGISCYGYLFLVFHSIQQLASEAVRASVSGLTDSERDALARVFVTSNLSSYPLLNKTFVVVTTAGTGSPNYTYKVSLSYDLSTSFVYQFAKLFPLPAPTILRTAVIQRGGY